MAAANNFLKMEKAHRNYIRTAHPFYYDTKKIVCLYIPGEFEFMQPTLIAILKEKVEDIYRRGLLW